MFEPLRIERHADPVVPDNLDQPAPGSSKNIEIADMRIPPEHLLHLQRQAVHALAHIRAADRQPHPDARGNQDHRRSSTSKTNRSAEALTPLPTRTRQPPANSISINPLVDAGEGSHCRSGVTVTGTSCRGADVLTGSR